MIAINYLDNQEIRKDIGPLFERAFPEDERPPADIFFSSFKKQNNKVLLGFYKENAFIGFTSLIIYKDICYIFFLAVSENKRKQGFGSKILDYVKNNYHKYNILLCYEEVDEKYDNYEERVKREQFYLHNGFKINPLKTNEFGVIFQTANIGNRVITFEDYQGIFESGFGKWAIKYLKEVS